MVTFTGGKNNLIDPAKSGVSMGDLVKGMEVAMDGVSPRHLPRKNDHWFQKLLPPIKEKASPHLLGYKARGDMLTVVFCSCGPIRILSSAIVDVFVRIRRRDGKQGGIVGVSIWGVSEALQEYKKSSISFENLIKRFDRHYKLPKGSSVFGEHKEQLLALARKHQFVWHIPK